MPKKSTIDPDSKRNELRTYRELSLGRTLKSERQRRRIAAGGKRRVIGDGSISMPYLAVGEARYREVRRSMQHQILVEARQQNLKLAPEVLLRQSTPRIEAMTYAVLAEEARAQATRHVANSVLGRALTKEEQACFAESIALGKNDEDTSALSQAVRVMDHVLHSVLGQIEQRQTHNPSRYQSVWAQIVGPDAAAQSRLEKIDANTQTAFFRCTNSVLSMDLQRRPQHAKKLALALGQPIKKLKAMF